MDNYEFVKIFEQFMNDIKLLQAKIASSYTKIEQNFDIDIFEIFLRSKNICILEESSLISKVSLCLDKIQGSIDEYMNYQKDSYVSVGRQQNWKQNKDVPSMKLSDFYLNDFLVGPNLQIVEESLFIEEGKFT